MRLPQISQSTTSGSDVDVDHDIVDRSSSAISLPNDNSMAIQISDRIASDVGVARF
jgi:hypothetical protein